MLKVALVCPDMSAYEPVVFDCHWIDPVYPVSVIVVPVPEQSDVSVAVAVPPTEEMTVTVASVELSGAQLGSVTVARK